MTSGLVKEQIVSDLWALGVEPGRVVLAHTSLSRIGMVEGGALTVAQALIDAVGPSGTMIFPAHTGNPDVSPENPPTFDVLKTPVSGIGVIPEAARRLPGALRSLHPTHSVAAFGKLAAWFVEGHERCATPCGEGSPYDKLRQVGGKILMLGCDHHANTSLHGVEELAGVEYHMLPGSGPARLIDGAGVEHRVAMRYHRWGVDRDFMRWDEDMTDLAIQRIGQVGSAVCRLVDAPRMWEYMLERLRADPGALLPEGYQIPELSSSGTAAGSGRSVKCSE